MRSLPEKNLKIVFFAVAPFIVKFRFEKYRYRYLLTHLQIFEVLLSDNHSTGPQNACAVLVPLPVLSDDTVISSPNI